MQEPIADTLAWYGRVRKKYANFAAELARLLRHLAEEAGLAIHVVEYRAKTVESLEEKLSRAGKEYQDPRRGVNDLAGIRCILYDIDDLPVFDGLVRRNFDVDAAASADKATLLQPSEFGYRSVHYVVSLTASRSNLEEWAAYRELRVEIQVRTILQHAWASLSHALQYKSPDVVPHSLQRDLFRMAALLEIADAKFRDLRREYAQVREKASIVHALADSDVPLDAFSLSQYLATSETIEEMARLAQRRGYEILDSDHDTATLTGLCRFLAVDTVGALDERLLSVRSSWQEGFSAMLQKTPSRTSRAAIAHAVIRQSMKDAILTAFREELLPEARLRALREVTGVEVRSIAEHVSWASQRFAEDFARRVGLINEWSAWKRRS
ncbi:MAG: hypothetical protein O6940_05920 [Ignavibacteria bacterium]|nr:hypothetical protein [Ignavibacteria bacterium]